MVEKPPYASQRQKGIVLEDFGKRMKI